MSGSGGVERGSGEWSGWGVGAAAQRMEGVVRKRKRMHLMTEVRPRFNPSAPNPAANPCFNSNPVQVKERRFYEGCAFGMDDLAFFRRARGMWVVMMMVKAAAVRVTAAAAMRVTAVRVAAAAAAVKRMAAMSRAAARMQLRMKGWRRARRKVGLVVLSASTHSCC